MTWQIPAMGNPDAAGRRKQAAPGGIWEPQADGSGAEASRARAGPACSGARVAGPEAAHTLAYTILNRTTCWAAGQLGRWSTGRACTFGRTTYTWLDAIADRWRIDRARTSASTCRTGSARATRWTPCRAADPCLDGTLTRRRLGRRARAGCARGTLIRRVRRSWFLAWVAKRRTLQGSLPLTPGGRLIGGWLRPRLLTMGRGRDPLHRAQGVNAPPTPPVPLSQGWRWTPHPSKRRGRLRW